MKNQKGFAYWVVVILISVMAIGLVGVAWYYEKNKEGDNINTSTITTNTSQSKCEQLKSDIKTLIEKVQYCEQDSDCFNDTSFNLGCPFGCSFVRNKRFNDSQDLLSLTKKIEYYGSTCPMCLYKCPWSSSQPIIICENNKCIDARF